MTYNPRPWWFRLALRFFPSRCREIPEARDPLRIVLRQFAIVKRHVYLQQFASSEDDHYFHSHQWLRMIAIGLYGFYTEERFGASERWRRKRVRHAPYIYTMDSDVIHRVEHPSPGQTSIFIGLWRRDDAKHYYPRLMPRRARTWESHILKMVERI